MDDLVQITVSVPRELVENWSGRATDVDGSMEEAILGFLRRHHLSEGSRKAEPTNPVAGKLGADFIATWNRRWTDLVPSSSPPTKDESKG